MNQVKLEAFEYDLIINNETNNFRVNAILEAITELNNFVIKEYKYLYPTVTEVLKREKNIFQILQEKFLDSEDDEQIIALSEADLGKTGVKLLEKMSLLVDTKKFILNTIYRSLAIYDHDKPYQIGKNIGYDKVYINVALVLFCYLKRNEILEVFYTRASKGVIIQDKAREAHTYIIGASKSGKSELIKDLIFSDFERENKSVILIEPHGDLAEQVAKLKGKNNDNLVYIDFTLDPEKTPVLNPFDITDRSSENIEIQAQALIDAFEDILGSEFSTQMEELLGATIRTLMQTGKGDFWELRRFMDDENNSDLITAGKASPNPKDRLFFNDGSFNQQSYKPTKNSLKSKIGTYLGYAVFRNFTTGKSTIDLKKLTDGKMWVIFNLSKGNIGKKVSPILGRFVIASLQNIILQRAKTTHRTPVYLYIDEFQNYTSETIEEIFSESRKYGFHLTVAHQNTGQLLGKMRDLIFSNTSVKIVGRNDTDQLKKLSNQILVEFGELDKLTTGKFYMRVEKNEAKPIQVGTKLLDTKYSMTAQEWEQVKAVQLDKYYTKIEQREPPTVSEPTSEKFDFNPSDTV
ncbi:MAG: type IV secretory system conjugative DNA transfer family protein [Thermoflexibacter sp.]|nr:type IV secretory system conjugative DNA transfer family protein [Thermoflexibacter sp.]